MAKRKNKHLVISDIKSFHQIYCIKTIIDRYFNGEMPEEIYNKFIKVISNGYIKAYFISFFKPSSPDVTKSPSPEIHKVNYSNNFKSTCFERKNDTSQIETSCQNHCQNIFTVKASDFTFEQSITGTNLVFRNYKSLYLVESQWFNSRVLNSINRTFQIRLSDYIGFTFIPRSDKDVFLNLIKEAYSDTAKQIYQENLAECFSYIEKYLNEFIDSYIYKCQNIVLETDIKDYAFNEDKQVFIYTFNALSYLGISESHVKLHIPLSNLIEQLNKTDRKRYYHDIVAKYPDGYHKTIDIEDIFPNRKSLLDVSIRIPYIFLDRLGKNKPIVVKATYSLDLGRFRSSIITTIHGYQYKTSTSDIIFDDCIKESLIKIMRKINNKFIITFYTAFIRLFGEGDSIVQSIYKKQTKKLNNKNGIYQDPIFDDWKGSNRYKSGLSPLLPFDTENNSDWMWLTAQMQKGIFLNAYTFIDKDETMSSKCGETKKYPVKIYLTVKDAGYRLFYIQDALIKVDTNVISMYALDEAKSIYRFVVDKTKTNESIFFIWSYFSSNNYNKRQDFDEILILKDDFGIYCFYKDSPLEIRTGIGYCDKKWLIDD